MSDCAFDFEIRHLPFDDPDAAVLERGRRRILSIPTLGPGRRPAIGSWVIEERPRAAVGIHAYGEHTAVPQRRHHFHVSSAMSGIRHLAARTEPTEHVRAGTLQQARRPQQSQGGA
jgi:hypothetical protein